MKHLQLLRSGEGLTEVCQGLRTKGSHLMAHIMERGKCNTLGNI